MGVWFVGALSLGVVLLLALGPRLTRRFLARRVFVHGHTEVMGESASIGVSSTRFTQGVFLHEFFHAITGRGDFIRDVPIAAAAEYVKDYSAGEMLDPAVEKRLRATVKEWENRRTRQGAAEFDRRISEAIDAVVDKWTGVAEESDSSYDDATRLAGLILVLMEEPTDRLSFLYWLGQGVPARLGLKAFRDEKYGVWAGGGLEAMPYELMEHTYQLRGAISDEDLFDLSKLLAVRGTRDLEQARRIAAGMNCMLRRIRDDDFRRIYELGSNTTVFLAHGDTHGDSRGIVRWGDLRPVVRLNKTPIDQFDGYPTPEWIDYVRDQVARIESRGGELGNQAFQLGATFEAGEFQRNQLEEGVVFVQWSSLISREAETVALVRDHHVVGGLITVNLSCNYPPVLLQELCGILWGALGHAPTGQVDSIYQNPLPRARALFEDPAYVHFLGGLPNTVGTMSATEGDGDLPGPHSALFATDVPQDISLNDLRMLKIHRAFPLGARLS